MSIAISNDKKSTRATSGIGARMLLLLVSVLTMSSAQKLRAAPDGEKISLLMRTIFLTISLVIVGFALGYGSLLVTGSVVAAIFVGVLVALFTLTIDCALVKAADRERAERDLDENIGSGGAGEFTRPSRLESMLAKPVKPALRATVAVATVFAGAEVLTMGTFSKELNAQLLDSAQAQAPNAVISSEAFAKRESERREELSRKEADLVQQAAILREHITRAHESGQTSTALDGLVSQKQALSKRLQILVGQYDQHLADAAIELSGKQLEAHHSGKSGAGRRYQGHIANAQRLEPRIDGVEAELRILNQEISEANDALRRDLASRNEVVATQLNEVERRLDVVRDALVAFDQGESTRRLDLKVVQAEVLATFGYVDRHVALNALKDDPAIGPVLESRTVLFKGLILILEISPFLAWMISRHSSSIAKREALERREVDHSITIDARRKRLAYDEAMMSINIRDFSGLMPRRHRADRDDSAGKASEPDSQTPKETSDGSFQEAF